MIETLTTNLLLLFFAVTLGFLGWRLFRDKDLQNFSSAGIKKQVPVYLMFMLALLTIYGIAALLGLSFASAVPFLLIGFILPALVSSSGLSGLARALIVLLVTVITLLFMPDQSEVYRANYVSFIGGLVSWKMIDYLISEEKTLEDFIPSFLFVVGMYWTKTSDPAAWLVLHQKLILGILSASILLKWIHGPYLSNDKLYFKRLSLAATGALFLLIYVNQFMVAMNLAKIAVVAFAGFFLAYLFDEMEDSSAKPEKSAVLVDIKKVLFVGIFTLLISRLFGMLGLIVLAASMLVSTTSGVALIAAAFWGARVFVQSFIFDFNSNMTGINIMHTYAGAALFAGFFLALALAMLIKNKTDSLVTTILFMSASIIAPIAAIYFLHAEPAASFLYSSIVGTSLLAFFANSFCDEDKVAKCQIALVLVPPQMIAFAILSNELISKGNTANIKERMIVLGLTFVATTLILWLTSRFAASTKKDAAEVSAES